MRTVRDHTALLAVVLATGLAASSCCAARSEDDASAERTGSIMEVELVCDENFGETTARWGRTGQARGCSDGPIRQGRWVFREEGYLNLEGFYEEGRKHGTWTVFNQDGTVFARIFFVDGRKTGKQFY